MQEGDAGILLDLQLLLHGWIHNHPIGPAHQILSAASTIMNLPTIEQIDTKDGKIWRVMYAGMVKEHRQEWQARVFYEQALQLAIRRSQRRL